MNRTFLLSPKYHRDNFNFIIKIFLNNDYPIKFIFETINLRLRSLLKRKTLKQTDKTNIDNKTISWFIIPFLPCIYDKFKSIIKNHNVKLSFFSLTNLTELLKHKKTFFLMSQRKI